MVRCEKLNSNSTVRPSLKLNVYIMRYICVVGELNIKEFPDIIIKALL